MVGRGEGEGERVDADRGERKEEKGVFAALQEKEKRGEKEIQRAKENKGLRKRSSFYSSKDCFHFRLKNLSCPRRSSFLPLLPPFSILRCPLSCAARNVMAFPLLHRGGGGRQRGGNAFTVRSSTSLGTYRALSPLTCPGPINPRNIYVVVVGGQRPARGTAETLFGIPSPSAARLLSQWSMVVPPGYITDIAPPETLDQMEGSRATDRSTDRGHKRWGEPRGNERDSPPKQQLGHVEKSTGPFSVPCIILHFYNIQ